MEDIVRNRGNSIEEIDQLSPARREAQRLKNVMVGDSPAMREVFEQIRRFAACDAPVLITGESGTGKELVARALYERSRRMGEPYVALNCAALPASLIASELFGYEKGAFTGAVSRKAGLIEHADRGTLFLDEIGDMPIDLQSLLLRFLQEGEILRLGGRRPLALDVRIVAATNVRLREAIGNGRLREDLFYRLHVLTIHLPPLRERGEDVELLAQYFLHQIGHEFGHATPGFTSAALNAIRAYRWPGNVRQLISTIRRAVVLSNGFRIDVRDLQLGTSADVVLLAPARRAPNRADPAPPAGDAERIAIVRSLQENGFNVSRAAKSLGIARATIYRLMKRHRIELRSQHEVRLADIGS